jgi:hypothetical protein
MRPAQNRKGDVPAPLRHAEDLHQDGDSGNKRVQGFCADCGTPIYAAAPSNTSAYGLRVGALDQRASLPPRRQIWCKSAVPWSARIEDVAKQETPG